MRVCTYALNTVYEMLYDSREQVDKSFESFPLSLMEKWYPDRDDLPPERFTCVVLEESDTDDPHPHGRDTAETFLDVEGNVREPDSAELQRIERWEEEWGSPMPPPQPVLPTLADWWEAKARMEEKQQGKSAHEDAPVAHLFACPSYAQAARRNVPATSGPSPQDSLKQAVAPVGTGAELQGEGDTGGWQESVGRRELRRRRKARQSGAGKEVPHTLM